LSSGAGARVLVAGGHNGAFVEGTAELFDPAQETWTPTSGAMSFARYKHTATRLPDGKVLVAGGATADGDDELSAVELFVPASGLWIPAGDMMDPRAQHTATLLSGGQGHLLVAGGLHPDYSLKRAELYDLSLESWTPTPNMSYPHFGHTATELQGGT